METFSGDIFGQAINIELGDLAAKSCDACIVPQFDSCVSGAGVGGAMIRAGAEKGMRAYQNHLDTHGGKLNFGEACLTSSGGGKAKYLLHVVSVDSGVENEFSTVQKAVFNALLQAQKRGVKTIAAPALGTGALGTLTPAQSAKAMMSAISQFAKGSGRFDKISLVIHDSAALQHEFAKVLEDKSYESAVPEAGRKPFDFKGWAAHVQTAFFGDSARGGRR